MARKIGRILLGTVLVLLILTAATAIISPPCQDKGTCV